MTGYISIVRNADIFIKSYKSNILKSPKSAFLKNSAYGELRNISSSKNQQFELEDLRCNVFAINPVI